MARVELTMYEWSKLVQLIDGCSNDQLRDGMNRYELTDEWIEKARKKIDLLKEYLILAYEIAKKGESSNNPRDYVTDPISDIQFSIRKLSVNEVVNHPEEVRDRLIMHRSMLETMCQQIDVLRNQITRLERTVKNNRKYQGDMQAQIDVMNGRRW